MYNALMHGSRLMSWACGTKGVTARMLYQRGGVRINSSAPHGLGLNNAMTAADGMYRSYWPPAAPVLLISIPTHSLCRGRVGECPVEGGTHVVPSHARPPPPFPSLPEEGQSTLFSESSVRLVCE